MSIISSETKSHGEGQGDYSGMLFFWVTIYSFQRLLLESYFNLNYIH